MKYLALPNPLVNIGHIYQATQLVDEAFAAGYFKNHLNEIKCAWVVLDGDTVVGWAAVSECMLRCIVVHPEYRGMGIGKRLTEERLKYLGNCNEVISYAWVRPNGVCMSCKNLENFGFELAENLTDYYAETRSNCKYCGKQCGCTARLYRRGKNV